MTIDEIIEEAIKEDIGKGDLTSIVCIDENINGKAKIISKQDAIVCGLELCKAVFLKINPRISFNCFKKDGDLVKKGETIIEIEGNVRSLLSGERLALNFLQRMSGIATYTHKIVQKVKKYGTKILDTRKTTPLMREIERIAVRAGGGYNHRKGLFDVILIKDNHIDFAGGIIPIIKKITKFKEQTKNNVPIIIEVRTLNDIKLLLKVSGIKRILMDNFSPAKLEKAIELIDNRVETEVSGGINEYNVVEYAKTGVQYISMGALTNKAHSIDMSMIVKN